MNYGVIGFIMILGVLIVSGCTSSTTDNTYNKGNVSFSYPNNWKISSDYTDNNHVGVSFDATGLLLGEVGSDTLLSGETVEDYIDEIYNDYTLNKTTINNQTIYKGSKTSSSNTDPSLGYYMAIFSKNNTVYVIKVNGKTADVEPGFNQIVNSFKVN